MAIKIIILKKKSYRKSDKTLKFFFIIISKRKIALKKRFFNYFFILCTWINYVCFFFWNFFEGFGWKFHIYWMFDLTLGLMWVLIGGNNVSFINWWCCFTHSLNEFWLGRFVKVNIDCNQCLNGNFSFEINVRLALFIKFFKVFSQLLVWRKP